MASRKVWGVVLGLGLLAACAGEVTEPDAWRMPGVLAMSGWVGTMPVGAGNGGGELTWDRQRHAADISAPQVLVAPDTVEAGQPFEVTTYTVGGSGCWRADGQTVQITGRVVVLKPYDAHSGSEVCTMILVFPAHSSTIVLDQPGEWTLRVNGRRVRMGDDAWEEPITAEKTIIVR